jgi:serine O-acetyltransferase
MSILSLIYSIRQRDEARPTFIEVILAYPGFHIMTLFHPVAHLLWRMRLRALARVWAHIGRFLTGIEIHPGAHIGKNLFIDHGMGIVIGETAIIGNECRLYHAVTLGGKGHVIDGKRHPTIGNYVTIGANSTILGPILIDDHAKIGANALVTIPVPKGMTALGNPARLVGTPILTEDDCGYGLPSGNIEDPLENQIKTINQQLADLTS